MLNHVTWSPLAQFQHAPVISGPPSVVAYAEEVEEQGGAYRAPLAVSEQHVRASWAGGRVGVVLCG